MCAINGKYHMKFIMNIYSSAVEKMSKEDFEELIRDQILAIEIKLNDSGKIRAHILEQEVK